MKWDMEKNGNNRARKRREGAVAGNYKKGRKEEGGLVTHGGKGEKGEHCDNNTEIFTNWKLQSFPNNADIKIFLNM